mmetsp:Transcript_19937/g.41690  ORF Transcript_19937/g.41690 Transcript_19937/m.41690 type:complete len:162 (-) Transcript_19937:20-505(-)
MAAETTEGSFWNLGGRVSRVRPSWRAEARALSFWSLSFLMDLKLFRFRRFLLEEVDDDDTILWSSLGLRKLSLRNDFIVVVGEWKLVIADAGSLKDENRLQIMVDYLMPRVLYIFAALRSLLVFCRSPLLCVKLVSSRRGKCNYLENTLAKTPASFEGQRF